jgi:hypothetical protein
MRLVLLVSTLAATLSVTASGQTTLSGSWKVENSGQGEHRRGWSMPTAIDLMVDGDKLTGTIRAGNWPGDSLIDGTINDDRFSFTAISQVNSSDGFPKMGFTGTVKGDTMTVTMDWLAFASCQTSTCSEITSRLPRKHQMVGQRVR